MAVSYLAKAYIHKAVTLILVYIYQKHLPTLAERVASESELKVTDGRTKTISLKEAKTSAWEELQSWVTAPPFITAACRLCW